MEEKLSIDEVISEVGYWLETQWDSSNISPSCFRDTLDDLENLLCMSFDEILESYPTLMLDVEEFDFDFNNQEFDIKLGYIIKEHIDYLKSQIDDYEEYDEEW